MIDTTASLRRKIGRSEKNPPKREILRFSSSSESLYSTRVYYGFSGKGANSMTKWLKLKEAAEHLKMGRSTIYKLANEGGIPAHKAGREWRFDADELDDWLKSGKLANPAEARNSEGEKQA